MVDVAKPSIIVFAWSAVTSCLHWLLLPSQWLLPTSDSLGADTKPPRRILLERQHPDQSLAPADCLTSAPVCPLALFFQLHSPCFHHCLSFDGFRAQLSCVDNSSDVKAFFSFIHFSPCPQPVSAFNRAPVYCLLSGIFFCNQTLFFFFGGFSPHSIHPRSVHFVHTGAFCPFISRISFSRNNAFRRLLYQSPSCFLNRFLWFSHHFAPLASQNKTKSSFPLSI